AEFAGEALAELGVERAHLVVHDFGGPIGLIWSMVHPDALSGITLINTGVLPGYNWHSLARIWRTPVLGELFNAIVNRPGYRFALNRNEPRGLPREFVDRMYDQYDRRTRQAVLKLYRATPNPGSMSENLIDLLAPRDIPALVIWGEDDAYLPSSFAHEQERAFPSAEVHMLPASGHWPFADAPEVVERLLVEFLARVGARTA
ncbi:MAG TPA: alpha/beta hydrolase, partial [Solirubrobacterales bacterium]